MYDYECKEKIYTLKAVCYNMQISHENDFLLKFLPLDIIDYSLRNHLNNLINGNYDIISNKEFLSFKLSDSLRALDYISVLEDCTGISLALEKFKNKLRWNIRENIKYKETSQLIDSLISSISFLVVNSPLNIRRIIVKKCIKFELLSFNNFPREILDHKKKIHSFLLSNKYDEFYIKNNIISFIDEKNIEKSHKLLWITMLIENGENISDLENIYGKFEEIHKNILKKN